MLFWNRYPVFRAFLALSLGISAAHYFRLPFQASVVFLGASLFASLFFGFSKRLFFGYKTRWLFGAAITSAFFFAGVVVTQLFGNQQSPLHLSGAPPKQQTYLLQLEEHPLEKENSYGARATLVGAYEPEFTRYNTKLMLYLGKSPAAADLKYGDRILIKARLNEVSPPRNPHEFDYRDYLRIKAIYYQAYADSVSWAKVSSGHGWWLLGKSKDLRQKMLAVIDQWRLSENEKAISKALLLGYRYDIEDDQLKAYAAAGAMHVLAVSGLHVGIVYLMASYLLFFLTKVKYGTESRMAVLILMLWFYAGLTGFSPSVVRAATMFSFVAIGTAFGRVTSIYNTILGSAILLLFIKPTYLFEVGFQLSYAAVFGIVWLQPKLSSLWQAPNWVLSKAWDIATVSIAAQLATFPLGLYYFHQFPSLFLLSNLAVIPLVTGLMYVGLFSLVISALGHIPHLFITLYSWFLKGMNFSVNWIEQQAFQLIDQIHITRLELALLYLIIFMICTWLLFGNYRRLVFALSAMIILSVSQWNEQKSIKNQSELTAYSIDGHKAIGLYSGEDNFFLADSSLLRDKKSMAFHVQNHWWARDAKKVNLMDSEENVEHSSFLKRGALLQFSNKTFWLAEDTENEPPRADCWILLSNCPVPKEAFPKPEMIVIGSKLDFWQRKTWREWCLSNEIDFRDITEEGAFVVTTESSPDALTAWLGK